MKNMLLASVALITTLAVCPVAHAHVEPQNQVPNLAISGEANGTVYSFKGSQREANGGRGNGYIARAESTRLNFDVRGYTTSWGGLEYSYLVGISGDPATGKNPVEENRIKLKGIWGTLYIGTHRGVDTNMPVGAFSTAGATGGVLGGNYTNVINTTTGANSTIDLVGTVKDTNRITYASPRVSGFQFGISVAALGHMKGESKPNSYLNPGSTPGASEAFTRNNVAVGLNHHYQINKDTKLQTSVAGVFARTEPGARGDANKNVVLPNYGGTAGNNINLYNMKRVASYTLGALLNYKEFGFGVEFMDHGTSMVYGDVQGAKAGQSVMFGVQYKHGIDRFSTGYLYHYRKMGDFKRNGNMSAVRNDAVHVTWDRTLAPGLNLFAEANYYDMKTDQANLDFQKAAQAKNSKLSDPVGNSHGHVLLAGIKAKF